MSDKSTLKEVMIFVAGRLVPVTLRGQITFIILLSVVLVVIVGRLTEPLRVTGPFGVTNLDTPVERMTLIAELMANASLEQREWLVEQTTKTGLNVRIVDRLTLQTLLANAADQHLFERWVFWLFPPDAQPPSNGGWDVVNNRPFFWTAVDDSTILIAEDLPPTIATSDFVGPLSYYVLAFGTLVVFFSIYAAHSVANPLARIVGELDRSDGVAQEYPVKEQGTVEMVRLAQALNAMRARLRGLIEARMRMLRSVSHDLRTPLTRMRLRAERLDDAALREAIIADIGQIDSLVTETLDYLRTDILDEETETVDLASLLQTIQSEFSDVGFPVRYDGPDRFECNCRPEALTRAINNLCDNALKFGGEATISLRRVNTQIWIDVSDIGPGIPVDKRALAIEPFYKMDSARSPKQRGGFGLGLSIVSDIVNAHGGTLEFHDREPHGLTVRLSLPHRQS